MAHGRRFFTLPGILSVEDYQDPHGNRSGVNQSDIQTNFLLADRHRKRRRWKAAPQKMDDHGISLAATHWRMGPGSGHFQSH